MLEVWNLCWAFYSFGPDKTEDSDINRRGLGRVLLTGDKEVGGEGRTLSREGGQKHEGLTDTPSQGVLTLTKNGTVTQGVSPLDRLLCSSGASGEEVVGKLLIHLPLPDAVVI